MFPLLISFLLIWLLSPLRSESATYHVSPTGNDARSCSTAPGATTAFRTGNAALACTRPGDTVQLAPGVYRQRIDLNRSPGGSAAGFVTVQGTPRPVGA